MKTLRIWWHFYFHKKHEKWSFWRIEDLDDEHYVSYHHVACSKCGHAYVAKRAWLKLFHPSIGLAKLTAMKTNQWS